MKFNQFIDRQDSLKRLRNALLRTTPQFLVIYGRRRIGKSTLIKEIMQDKDVYFLSDQTNEANQRALFAKAIAYSIPRFDKVVYPDWETLLLELNDRFVWTNFLIWLKVVLHYLLLSRSCLMERRSNMT